MTWKERALDAENLNEELRAEIDALKAEIATLKKNSRNSSKPPSSDIVKPPKQQDQRRKRKIGGQKGHTRNLRKPFDADHFCFQRIFVQVDSEGKSSIGKTLRRIERAVAEGRAHSC
jgi:hypothetical protein